jgi:hypothetical protein
MKLKNLFASDPSTLYSSMEDDEDFCCGKHAICKKSKAVQSLPEPIEYYDDEELDVFKNRSSNSYTGEEIKQFTEIYHTLLESDLPGWFASLSMRNITPPQFIRQL